MDRMKHPAATGGRARTRMEADIFILRKKGSMTTNEALPLAADAAAADAAPALLPEEALRQAAENMIAPQVLLPKGACGLAKCCAAKGASVRYPNMASIQLELGAEGAWQLTATNGVILGQLSGITSVTERRAHPGAAENMEASRAKREAVLAAKPLGAACKSAEERLGVTLAENHAVYSGGAWTSRVPYVNGKFPDYKRLMPTARPQWIVRLAAADLALLLAAAMTCIGKEAILTFELHQDGKPICLRGTAAGAGGAVFTGLIMPKPSQNP